jgi:hypothetical protein
MEPRDIEPRIVLNLDDPFERVVYDMVKMKRRKRADYAGDGNPFQNFIDSSYQINATPGVSCEVLIGTKQSRLRNLLGTDRDVQNESVEDTILDRAVYSTLALAMYREGLYDKRWAEKDHPDPIEKLLDNLGDRNA